MSATLLALGMAACNTNIKPASSNQTSEDASSSSSSSKPVVSSSESSSQSQPSSSSEEPPIQSDYFYTLNGAQHAITGAPSTDPGEDTWVAQYAIPMSVSAGDILLFYKNGAQLDVGASGTGNNALYDVGTHELTVRCTESNATAYFKIYDNEGTPGYDVWLEGYSGEIDPPEPPESLGYALKFLNGSEQSYPLVADGKDLQNRDQFFGDNIQFTKDDQFTIVNLDNQDQFAPNVEGWSFGGDSEESKKWQQYIAKDDDCYYVGQDFLADVFVKLSWGDDLIMFNLEGEEPPVPEEDNFYWRLNENEYTQFDVATIEDIMEDEQDIGDQYYVEFSELTAGDILTFKHDDTQVYPWPNDGANNALRNGENLIEVRQSCENVKLYFKYYPEDSYNPGQHGYSLWLEGYVAPELETIYFKPNNQWKADGARFAVYFSDETWLTMADLGNGYYSFEPGIHTEGIFCRMNGAELENNWDNKWNQTPAYGDEPGYVTFPDDGTNLYTLGGANDGWDGCGGKWSIYVEPTIKTIYCKMEYSWWTADGAAVGIYC